MVARSARCLITHQAHLLVVAFVGAFTAIFAASIGLVQTDIKKVLAYSTVSQLGYMFLACGAGAYAAGVFHLMTHAFFKALLFLAQAALFTAWADQDIRKMGGLRHEMPWTYRTFLVGTIAIAGIPPLAGFFSKDAILWARGIFLTTESCFGPRGVTAAAFTSFYMFRLVILTFHGSPRYTHEDVAHVHESPPSMLIPLVVLAIFNHCGICGCSISPRRRQSHRTVPDAGSSRSGKRESGGQARSKSSSWRHRPERRSRIGLAYLFYVAKPELPERLADKGSRHVLHRVQQVLRR